MSSPCPLRLFQALDHRGHGGRRNYSGLDFGGRLRNMALYDMSPRGHNGVVATHRDPCLLILLSLAGQPRHGYSILKDVEQMSDGRVVLSTGTLYGALRRLLEDDWIERIEEEDSREGARRIA